MFDKIVLPEGWSKEWYCGDVASNIIVVRSTNKGYVTINFNRRWWNLGYGYSRFSSSFGSSNNKQYTGRSWRKELVDDAIAALQKAEA